MTAAECFERAFTALDRAGCRPRLVRDGEAKSFCPHHRDIRPSLGLKQTAVGAILTCFARCPRHKVERTLGIAPGELLAVRLTDKAVRQRTIAEYAYEDALGTVVAVKVRRVPKSFRWRLPSGAYRLAGVALPIFNQPALIDARRVFVAEGEKAVQRLAELQLPATCPPAGASCWKPEWSSV